MRTLKVLIDGLAFPEGPRWHDGKFYFSDMHAHQVLEVDMAGKSRVVCEVHARAKGLQVFRIISMDESTAVHPNKPV